jgi:osmotically-inducible protein OsmY
MTVTRYYFAILSLVGAAALAQGCAPLVVAGAGTAAVAAHDRRSVGAFIDDSAIELQVRTAIDADEAMKRDTHINATSVNGIVLLSGEAASGELRDRVLAKVREIGSIRRIVNEIRIASPSSIGSRTHDTWITTKIKTKLIGTEHLDSTRIKVVTEHDAVYLMGIVTRKEAKLATNTATTVDGVTRVVKLFEYLD